MNSFRTLVLAGTVAALLVLPTRAQDNLLVTGKKITLPPLGTTTNVDSFPVNLILSPDGRYAVTTGVGSRQRLWSVDVATGTRVQAVPFDQTSFRVLNPSGTTSTTDNDNGLYYGLAFAPDNTLYIAQGSAIAETGGVAPAPPVPAASVDRRNLIAVARLNPNGELSVTGRITTQPRDFPAGLALDNRGFLYVVNSPSAADVKGSLAVYNRATGTEVGRVELTDPYGATTNYPYAVATLADGGKTYVSSQRNGVVYVVNTTNPAAPVLLPAVPSGSHPVALLLNRAQTRLFVANAQSDTVSVVNTATDGIERTILLRPDGARGVAGVTPTNLALSPDEQTLYVTLGDMNTVAVVEAAGRYRLRGFVPVGWYPTAVAVSPDNGRLLVVNGKGSQTRNPNPQYTPYTNPLVNVPANRDFYVENLIVGNVQTIGLPISAATLAGYTQQVIENNRITPLTDNPPANPLANINIGAGKIKHVIYVIKENRTYDQVFGALKDDKNNPLGNGDPTLSIFGTDITPNQHALAKRFVLLDNFFDCGEVSGDGWPWSTQGHANEFVAKNVRYNYAGRARSYDFEGQNNNYPTGGFPATDLDGRQLSDVYPNGLPPIPDVSEAPGGYLWDAVGRAGLTLRNYGCFVSFGNSRFNLNGTPNTTPVTIPDNYPSSAGLQPGGSDLKGVTNVDFRRYELQYADSDATDLYARQDNNDAYRYARRFYGKYNAPSRFSAWKRDFDQMLREDPTGGRVPNFMILRLGNDHTNGYPVGQPTPRAMVADNDYAVGQIVEAVSRSPIWPHSAIVILEDDAQNGPDHVDAHRSICFVVSPYIKRASVDSTFYNTVSAIKTMKLLLGLPNVNQYEAVSDHIGNWDTTPSNDAPYAAILPAKAIVVEKVPPPAAMAKANDPSHWMIAQTKKMNFDLPDNADSRILNEIIWKSVKGPSAKMPEPIFSGIALADRVIAPAESNKR